MALRRDPPERRTGPELYRRSPGRLTLNLGDLEDIMALLRARTKTVVLRAGRALADEVADLKEATSTELLNVTFVTENLSLTIQLGGTAEVSTTDASDDSAKALVDDLVALLEERRNFWAGSSALWAFVSIGVGGAFLIFFLIAINPKRDVSEALLPVLLMAAMGLLLGTVAWRDHVKGGLAVVEPNRLSDRRMRLQGVWLNVAIAIASALIATVLTYWQVAAK